MPKNEGKWNVGIEFQLKTIAYATACLSENENVEDFEIYTNQNDVPGFDDIIIKVKYKSELKPSVYLGQIKHVSKKISFKGKKHSLRDYVAFIVKITNEREQNPFLKKLFQDVPDENIQYWYYSNSFFYEPLTRSVELDDNIHCYIESDETNKSIFPVRHTVDCYKLVTKSFCKYSNAISQFRFLLNQPDCTDISRCIVDLNTDMFSIETANSIIQYVHEYFKISANNKLTKHVYETELLKLCLSPFIVPPTTVIEIEPQLADMWNELTMQHDVTIIDNTSKQMKPYIFGCLSQRIKHLCDCTYDWNKCITNFEKVVGRNKFIELTKAKKFRYWLFVPDTIDVLLVEMWKCDYLPLLLSSDTKASILDKYKHLNKSFVILDNRGKIHKNISGLSLKVFSSAADIRENKLGKEFLKGVFISIQGREPVDVFSVVDGVTDLMLELKCPHLLCLIKDRRKKKESLLDIAGSEKLEKNPQTSNLPINNGRTLEFINGDSSNSKQIIADEDGNYLLIQNNRAVPIIGRSLENCEKYISRYLRQPTLDASIFESKRKIICIVTGNLNAVNSIRSNQNEIAQLSVDEALCRIETKFRRGENTVVAVQDGDAEELWSKASTKECPLLHVRVENGVMLLLKYQNCPNLSTHISYEGQKFSEKSFFQEISAGITVVTGEPGSGKSALFRSLFNACDRHSYSLFCDLNDYRHDLSEPKAALLENPLNFILEKESKQSTLSNNQYPFCCSYSELLPKFLERTKEPVLFLDSFDEILPLCKEPVLHLIRNLNKRNVRLIIASRLVMTDILINSLQVKPIKIEALNESDIKTFMNVEKLSDCELPFNKFPPEFRENPMYLNFLITLHRRNELPTTITISTLYNAIIQKHVERNYNKRADTFTSSQYKDMRKDILDIHKLLALAEIFGDEIMARLGLDYKKLMDYCINTDKVKLGLIVGFNGARPVFSHRTFAEFMVAEWLSENFEQDYVRDIYKMLFHDSKAYIRRLLDDILCEHLPLHKAILAEDLTLVASLCSDCDNYFEEVDKFNRTPLHLASANCSTLRSKKGNYLILEEILVHMDKKKFDFNVCDMILKWTWFDYLRLNEEFFQKSCSFGLIVTLETYLDSEERAIKGKDIIRCIENRNLDTAMVLLRRNISLLPTYFYFFVVMAIDVRCLSVLRKLIELQNYNNMQFNALSKACRNVSSTINVLNCTNLLVEGGFTALHVACIYGNIHVIQQLLNLSVKTDAVDDFQHEAMYYGVIQGSAEMVTTILEHMSRRNVERTQTHTRLILFDELITLAPFEWTFLINLYDNIYQPNLHISVKRNWAEIVKILLENGFDVNQRNTYGETALHNAVEKLNVDIIRVLLAHGANINASSNRGDNALHIVAGHKYAIDGKETTLVGGGTTNNREEITKLLLEHDGNADSRNDSGDTPLHIATGNNNSDVVEILLEHGAQSNLKNKDRNTALHIATRNRYNKIVELLSAYGSKSNIKDKCGNTALDIAVRNGDADTIKILFKRREKNDHEAGAALHIAARHGNVKSLRILLDQGVNISAKNNDGSTVLHIATRNRRVEVVKELLKRLIDVENEDKNGDTALHIAARKEDTELLQILLNHGANRNHTDKDGNTILHIATRKRNVALVKLLLTNFGDSNQADQSTDGALHIAARNGSIDIINILLENGANIYYKDEDGKTALDIAIRKGFVDAIRALSKYLENDTAKSETVLKTNFQDQEFCTNLHVATRNGEENLVVELLKQGINCNGQDFNGDSSLHIASRYGNRGILEVLLENGANHNLKNVRGDTALLIAVKNKDEDMVKSLLEYGADCNYKDQDGNACLHICTGNGNLTILKLLLKHGANGSRCDGNGNTALHIIASCTGDTGNSMGAIRLLLDNASNINQQRHDGDTPLHVAAVNGNLCIVKMLLKNGANINLKNKHGETPLHVVLDKRKNLEILVALLDNGANVGCKDNNGDTALHIATRNDSPNIVKLLLKTGVSLNYKNNSGNTALHIATENNDANLVKILADNGADVNVQNEDGSTALLIAVRRRSVKIAAILLQNGADVSLRNNIGDTALHAAAKRESKEIVKVLLDQDTHANSVNKEGQLAIYIASRYKNESVVKILLEYDSDCQNITESIVRKVG